MGHNQPKNNKLCNEGRVERAVLMGHTWNIPKDAAKPDEQKRGSKSIKTGGNDETGCI